MKPQIILIDDEACNGWKEILEIVLFNKNEIDVSETVLQGQQLISQNKYFDVIITCVLFLNKQLILNSFGNFELEIFFLAPLKLCKRNIVGIIITV